MFEKLDSLLGLGADAETLLAKRRMLADSADQRRRFVQAALAIGRDLDPAYRPAEAESALAELYGIHGREQLVATIYAYLAGRDSTAAYDAFSAMFLARAGVGARLLTELESWTLAFEAGKKIQRSYTGWTFYALGYLHAHLARCERLGEGAEKLERSRAKILARMSKHESEIWSVTPFDAPLG
jgi:hypothetical protein